jgi:hypothetical protein
MVEVAVAGSLKPRGLYIGKYSPPGGGKYRPMSFGEKYEKAKGKWGKM